MWHKLGSWLQEIRSADLRWVLCAVVVYWLGAVAVAMRFRQFLRGLHCNVTLKETLLANLAFTFVNNVTPVGSVVNCSALRFCDAEPSGLATRYRRESLRSVV